MTPGSEQPSSIEVIQTHVAIYAISFLAWVVCAFVISATLASDGVPSLDIVAMLVPLVGMLFNATGLLRPKRIQLKREELEYRPVWGRTRALIRKDITGFDVVYFHRHSGFLTCKAGAGRLLVRRGPRYGFGFFFEAYGLADRLEAWRRS